MERRLAGRRASSKLPALVELVICRPLVSAGMVSEILGVQAALRIVDELGLKEMTGRPSPKSFSRLVGAEERI